MFKQRQVPSLDERLDPPNVTRLETADQLGVTAVTLDRWVRMKKFPPPIKFGDSRNAPTRWRQSTIDQWVAEKEAQG